MVICTTFAIYAICRRLDVHVGARDLEGAINSVCFDPGRGCTVTAKA
jgi:hypothetical protein